MTTPRLVLTLTVALLSLGPHATLQAAADTAYQQHNLVSDGAVAADQTDPTLVNPWSIVFDPNGVIWIANNHSGTPTLYDGAGIQQS